jgi:hypothetical protein
MISNKRKAVAVFIFSGLVFLSTGCGQEPSLEIEENEVSETSGIVSSPILDEEALRQENESSSNSSFLPDESFIGSSGDVNVGIVDNNTYVDLDLIESEPAIVGEEVIVRLGEGAIFFAQDINKWDFGTSSTSSTQKLTFSKELPENSRKESGLMFFAETPGNYVVSLKNKDTGMLLEFFVKIV